MLDIQQVDHFIQAALAEDIGRGDLTSNLTIGEDSRSFYNINSREAICLCGVDIALRVMQHGDNELRVTAKKIDGENCAAGELLLSGEANTRAILATERLALNLLQHLSAVATQTQAYVKQVAGSKAKILDTRKTIPGLRMFQKYAVAVGGGTNHRFGLDDGILIKDNHIAAADGDVAAVLKRIKDNAPAHKKIEIECDTKEQAIAAANAGADILLLDNMPPALMKEIIQEIGPEMTYEASGNVTLENVRSVAESGVDFISIGALTHSVVAVDIGMDF